MTFERTSFGLSNEHLFLDVDFVVYCEGDVEDSDTHDEMFWERVLNISGLTFVCKSKGSKGDIVPLAQRAIAESVTNVAFAMDRDYGDYYGLPILSENVFYTYGYSWENDVLIDIDIPFIFSMFAPTKSNAGIDEAFTVYCSLIKECCNEATRVDIRFFPSSNALFDRRKPQSIVCGEGDDLRIDVEKLKASASAMHDFTPTISLSDLEEISWERHFFGKTTSKLIYHWLVQKSQAIQGRSKIPFDAFLRMCIRTMKIEPEQRDRDRYYQSIIERFIGSKWFSSSS